MKKMSAAAACTQLKAALAPFGFLALKPHTFWGKTAEIVQVVDLAPVRRAAVHAAASRMHRATLHAIRHGKLALQLPVAAHASSMLAEARAATLQQMASTPANALPQI
jgi:hypothetical protein